MTYKLVLARRGIPTLTHCDQSVAARWQPMSIVQHPRDYWRSFVLNLSGWCSRGPCQPSPKAQDADPEAGSPFIISALISALITLDNQRSARAQGNPDNLAEFWTNFIVNNSNLIPYTEKPITYLNSSEAKPHIEPKYDGLLTKIKLVIQFDLIIQIWFRIFSFRYKDT